MLGYILYSSLDTTINTMCDVPYVKDVVIEVSNEEYSIYPYMNVWRPLG
jgi:hypothetical protein